MLLRRNSALVAIPVVMSRGPRMPAQCTAVNIRFAFTVLKENVGNIFLGLAHTPHYSVEEETL